MFRLQILPVLNNKGGVGKTTTCVHLAVGLARRGQRVLLVDLDGQRSASLALGLSRKDRERTSGSLLYGTLPLSKVIRKSKVPGLDFIPGSMELSNADLWLSRSPNRVGRIADVLAPARMDYDVVLIDCAPSMSLLNVNVLVAADALVVPLAPSYLSIQGLISFGETIRMVRSAMGRMAPVLGIALTMRTLGDPDAEKVEEAVRARYGGKVFNATIRSSPVIEEAFMRHETVFDREPSGVQEDYSALADEVLERLGRYAALFASQVQPLDRSTQEAIETAAIRAAELHARTRVSAVA
ncbi:MAG: ParA family protein [Bacteroidota bacterium]